MPASDELVLAVPTAALFPHGAFQGLEVGGGAYFQFIHDPRNSRYLPRSRAEQDPAWKQIIPYVILTTGSEVFVYRRGKQSTESRLVALHSVGLGGHIRHSDEGMFVAAGWDGYQAALQRELDEEVAIETPVVADRLVGLINDDSVEVGTVHVGLVHIRELAAPAVRARESKIAGGRFAPVEELLAPGGPPLETWSRLCLEGWDRLRAHPGWLPGNID
ncbi:MAG TPA: hypothetical protein VN515_03810 [Terriglobales bacterium]|nr:hypothetical protein [Terriglobales bacterium]